MKILVRDGTGYIGAFLCSRLLQEGHEIVFISRSDKCISDMLDAINNSRSLHMSPNEQEICFLYVEDAVDEIIHGIESKNLRTFQGIYTYTVMGKEVFQLKETPIKIAQILKSYVLRLFMICPTEILKLFMLGYFIHF